MYGKASDNGFVELLPGIAIKTLCHGEHSTMVEFRLKKGALLPEHRHPNEQTGYLLKGKMRLYSGPVAREVGPGDSWSIPKDLLHKAEILEDSVAVEVFSPPRLDYHKYLLAADIL
jgi:quercetin dioxygenase-like cupin family protein